MNSLIWKTVIAVSLIAGTGIASATFIYSKDASGAAKIGLKVMPAKNGATVPGGIFVKTAPDGPDLEELSETVLALFDDVTGSFLKPFEEFTASSSVTPIPFKSRSNPVLSALGSDPLRSKILAPFTGGSSSGSTAGLIPKSAAGSSGGVGSSRAAGASGGAGGSGGGSGAGSSPDLGSKDLPQNEELAAAVSAPVTTVPLPPAVPLLLAAFAGLSLLRKRKAA